MPSNRLLTERITHERELRELSEKYQEAALKLQALEYERRLDSLNHEGARIAKAAESSVSRELFDARITPLEIANSRFAGGQATLLAIFSIGGIVAGVIIGIISTQQ